MWMSKNNMNEDEERYVITPKGIFSLALTRTNLVESIDDWRVDAAWAIFELMMKQGGYIVESNDDK